MRAEVRIAEDLAARLNSVRLGHFEAREGTVSLFGAAFHVPLSVVSAGRGRPYEVERALGRGVREDVVIGAVEFTPGALNLLETSGANYVDRRRLHVRLAAPAYMVHVVDGEEQAWTDIAPATALRLSGASGGVAIALLDAARRDPQAPVGVRFVSDGWSIPLATVQKVFAALERDGLLRSQGSGPRKRRFVTDPSALLDRYAIDAAADRRLSVPCRVLAESVTGVLELAASGLVSANVRFAVSGAAAASLEAPALTAVPLVDVWVDGPRTPEYLLSAVDGLRSDCGANLILRRTTTAGPMKGWRPWGETGHRIVLASPFRVYADLLADPRRGREQAEVYREQVIRF